MVADFIGAGSSCRLIIIIYFSTQAAQRRPRTAPERSLAAYRISWSGIAFEMEEPFQCRPP